jgi:hypothetical protein
MLEEISKYDHLGTADYFLDAIQLLETSDTDWSKSSLAHFFSNKIYKSYPYIDGGIEVLMSLGVIKRSGKSIKLAIDKSQVPKTLSDTSTLIISLFLNQLEKNNELFKLFNPQAITRDSVSELLIVGPQSFPLRYRPIRRMLIDLGLLTRQPSSFSYQINAPYDLVFSGMLSKESATRTLSIDQLKDSLLRQEVYGAEAEEFVVHFESKRLAGNPRHKMIKRISDIDVTAGYDIISFHDNRSQAPDRFIEVKSFTGKPSFYWSENEISTAKAKQKNYYLYLVDRSKMAKSDYMPLIIQNPYEVLYNSESWVIKPSVLFLSKVD